MKKDECVNNKTADMIWLTKRFRLNRVSRCLSVCVFLSRSKRNRHSVSLPIPPILSFKTADVPGSEGTSNPLSWCTSVNGMDPRSCSNDYRSKEFFTSEFWPTCLYGYTCQKWISDIPPWKYRFPRFPNYYTWFNHLCFDREPSPQVQFVLPKAAMDHLQRKISCGSAGIDEVIESLSQVNSRQAKAWKLADEMKVKLGPDLIGKEHERASSHCHQKYLIFFIRLWFALDFVVYLESLNAVLLARKSLIQARQGCVRLQLSLDWCCWKTWLRTLVWIGMVQVCVPLGIGVG